jgi:hypothetical protein
MRADPAQLDFSHFSCRLFLEIISCENQVIGTFLETLSSGIGFDASGWHSRHCEQNYYFWCSARMKLMGLPLLLSASYSTYLAYSHWPPREPIGREYLSQFPSSQATSTISFACKEHM